MGETANNCRICDEIITSEKSKVFCEKDHYRPCLHCGQEYFVKKVVKPPVFCSSSCGAQYRALHREMEKQCGICGDAFTATNANARYCSKLHYKTCLHCGEEFPWENISKKKDYCSRECSLAHGPKGNSRPCALCGETFIPKTKNGRFCYKDHHVPCKHCSQPILVKAPKRVPTFCSASCSSSYTAAHPPLVNICKECGDEFPASKVTDKFCKKDHERTCPICGNAFSYDPYSSTTTCSRKCGGQLVDYQERNAKARETLLDKYGVATALAVPGAQEKAQATLIKNYGVTNPSLSEEVKEKRKQANLERYGVENGGGAPEVQERIRKTNQERYGVTNVFQAPEVKERIKRTLQEKYGRGVTNPLQVPSIKAKAKATLLEKYGVECMLSLPEVQLLSSATQRKRISQLNRRWKKRLEDDLGVSFTLEEPFAPGMYADLAHGDLHVEVNPTVSHNSSVGFAHTLRYCTLPECSNPRHAPLAEAHHHERFLAAEAAGKTLLQYFDWYDEEIFLSIVRSKLKLDEHRVAARKCEVREITQKEANGFLRENHLLGAARGQTFSVGLFFQEELVHVHTYGPARLNRNYEWEAIRSASKMNWHVQGGYRKCDSHFFRKAAPKSVVSYVDLALSTGATEAANSGWRLLSTNRGGEMWVKIFTGPGPAFIRGASARRLSADRLLGFEVGAKYPSHHPDGRVFTNADVLLAEGYVQMFDAGTRTFAWGSPA